MTPVLIGVTGNVGGGKSTIMNHLRDLGFETLSADTIAKEVIYVPKNYGVLKDIFGESIFEGAENIDFKQVSNLFFQLGPNGDETRNFVYNYFHHDIWRKIERKILQMNKFFVFIENAVLFEQEMKKYFNFIVCVYSEEEEAGKRIRAARNWSEERIEAVMKIQMPLAKKIGLSDLSLNTTHIPLSEMKNLTRGMLEVIGIQV
jgi:dephospho-CoA kinase